jgi:hypothetical protein
MPGSQKPPRKCGHRYLPARADYMNYYKARYRNQIHLAATTRTASPASDSPRDRNSPEEYTPQKDAPRAGACPTIGMTRLRDTAQ